MAPSKRIVFEKAAVKFIKKQPKSQAERILKAINNLPDFGDIKMLKGYERTYRLRVGDYRAIYTVVHETNEIIVDVIGIDSRGQIYK